jgi:cytochrome P450
MFGPNIITSEGEEWKKYRKIAAPAFSEVRHGHVTVHRLSSTSSLESEHDHQRNNKLVWDETTRIMVDLFDNVWGDRSEIVVDHCLHVTLPVCYL